MSDNDLSSRELLPTHSGLRLAFCRFEMCDPIWSSSMTTAPGRPLLQDKRSNSKEVVPLDSQVLYLILDVRVGFLVLE